MTFSLDTDTWFFVCGSWRVLILILLSGRVREKKRKKSRRSESFIWRWEERREGKREWMNQGKLVPCLYSILYRSFLVAHFLIALAHPFTASSSRRRARRERDPFHPTLSRFTSDSSFLLASLPLTTSKSSITRFSTVWIFETFFATAVKIKFQSS